MEERLSEIGEEELMTLEELKNVFNKVGLDVEAFTSSAQQKLASALESEKAKMDTEPRRKCRVFWVSVAAGVSLGALVFGFIIGSALR